MWKLIYFGITYALVFTGYYVTTSFLNIIFPDTAFIGFAIFYAIAGFGCLISPYIVEKLPLKLSLIIAISLYLIFIGSVSSFNSTFMLIAYAFCGIGSSIIWLIQGIITSAFKSNNSIGENKTNADKGKSMGIFYAIFGINMILGNIIALVILITNVKLQIMIWSMLGISGIGLILCLFISNSEIEVPKIQTGVLRHILDVILVSKNNFSLILPVCAQSMGLNISFQILPRMMLNTPGPVNIYNSAMFLAYGVSYVLASLVTGKLFNKNWRYVLYPYILLDIGSLAGILILGKINQPSGYWIIISFVRGITDTAINNTCNISFGKNNPVDLSFAFYRLIYSFSYILGSLIVGYIIYEYVLLVALMVDISGIISFHIHIRETNISEEPELSIEKQFDSNFVVL